MVAEFEIANVVGTVTYQQELDLSALAETFKQRPEINSVTYEPAENHWLQARFAPDDTYRFHITIASNLDKLRPRMLEYVRSEYELDMELYAKRVSALDGRDMMWEWDIPRSTELPSREATSKESWKKTTSTLRRRTGGEFDQSACSENLIERLIPWMS